jgi:UDP-glucose 4-epimerase
MANVQPASTTDRAAPSVDERESTGTDHALARVPDDRPIVVTGATGNLGTSIVPALLESGRSVVSITRHRPTDAAWTELPGVRWHTADVGVDTLDPAWFEGAAAVIHLAWAIQPSHRPEEMFRTNVTGTRRVIEAAAAANVAHFIHASSVGAYGVREHDALTNEADTTDGASILGYSWQKAYVERLLDLAECDHPQMVVTRLRPAIVLGAAAATRVHALFAGRVPKPIVAALADRADLAPVRFQVVHPDDVADAVVLVLERRFAGPVNLAADGVLGGSPPGGRAALRVVAFLTGIGWRLRIVAVEGGWIRLAAGAPVMDSGRARDELGWTPRWPADAVMADFAVGLREPLRATRKPAAPNPHPHR